MHFSYFLYIFFLFYHIVIEDKINNIRFLGKEECYRMHKKKKKDFEINDVWK